LQLRSNSERIIVYRFSTMFKFSELLLSLKLCNIKMRAYSQQAFDLVPRLLLGMPK